jgi:DNA-binding response OmpR family regulator
MKTILVIDDEANIRQLYHDELTDAGYRVLTAANWGEAQPVLAASAPDLVTLDIKMEPGPNGIEVLRLIKEARKDLPVIMLTAYGDYKADFGVWASEAYVVKSSDLTEVKQKIAQLLGGEPATP